MWLFCFYCDFLIICFSGETRMMKLNCWQQTVDNSMEVTGTVTKHWQLCNLQLFKETFCWCLYLIYNLFCWIHIHECKVSCSLSFWTQQPYSIECLHLPGHPMATLVLRTAIKETQYSFLLLWNGGTSVLYWSDQTPNKSLSNNCVSCVTLLKVM